MDAGDHVTLQEIWRGRHWVARPATVVADEPDLLSLWVPHGTAFKAPSNPRTRPLAATPRARMLDNLHFVDWNLRDVQTPHSTLYLMPRDAWFAAWRSWLSDGSPFSGGWYVNFQEPFRTANGRVRTMDLALDLLVDPTGHREVKDQSEFDTLRSEGLIDEHAAEQVLAALEDVHQRLDATEAPFEETWTRFKPATHWTSPVLGDGWDDIDT